MVFNRDRETLTTSLAVAKAYVKAHKNVLASIDAIVTESGGLELSRQNFLFREATYPDRGKSYRMVEMNEEAFSLLVGGFTGAEALPRGLHHQFKRITQPTLARRYRGGSETRADAR